jgi:hypothetical protein
MGQRRLFEWEDGTTPGEVWDTLPAPAQSQVTLQLARLILRLWQQPAADHDEGEEEEQGDGD